MREFSLSRQAWNKTAGKGNKKHAVHVCPVRDCHKVGPSYQTDDGSKKRLCFSQHAKPGMVSTTSKRCAYQGCLKNSSRGADDGSKKAEYCSHQAKPGMVDVIRCRLHCRRQPSFGVDDGNKRPEYCFQHAKAGMVNIKRKSCSQQGCKVTPSYGVDDGSKKAEYCSHGW